MRICNVHFMISWKQEDFLRRLQHMFWITCQPRSIVNIWDGYTMWRHSSQVDDSILLILIWNFLWDTSYFLIISNYMVMCKVMCMSNTMLYERLADIYAHMNGCISTYVVCVILKIAFLHMLCVILQKFSRRCLTEYFQWMVGIWFKHILNYWSLVVNIMAMPLMKWFPS